MMTTRNFLSLLLCLFVASCKTLTPQGAEEYLQGRWQFDREAKDLGYLDEMPEGDDFFVSFSSNKVVVTFVEGGKVESDTTDVGSILIDPEGIIEIRQYKKKHT